MEFYRCKHCGNILKVEKEMHSILCCQEEMEKLIPGSVDAAQEKHVPKVEIGTDVIVTVGEVEHPMIEEHYIEWILLELENGYMVKNLKPNEKPAACFKTNERVKAVYAYCNLHGLWKTEV